MIFRLRPHHLTLAAACLLLSFAPPAKSAGKKWTCYFQATLTNPTFQDALCARLQRHWRAPAAHPRKGQKTVVRTVLGRDGTVRSSELHLTSGTKAWDEAVLAAIRAAAPYPALPKDYAYDSFEVDSHVEP